MSESIHVRVSDVDKKAIQKVQSIMRSKGFPEPTMTEAVKYALHNTIANFGKKDKA